DEGRPSRRESPGARDRFGARADHEPESWVHGGRGEPAFERPPDASLAVRRNAAGHRACGCARVLVPGAPGGEPRAARPAAAVPALLRDDEGLPAPDRGRGGAMTAAFAAAGGGAERAVAAGINTRSEERRVGKEGSSGGCAGHV